MLACPQVLDEPLVICGLEFDDGLWIAALEIALLFCLNEFLWLASLFVTPASVYFGKRGKPPGAIPHWVHAQCAWLPWWPLGLPGVVPARQVTYTP
jgi:hypothetical protein